MWAGCLWLPQPCCPCPVWPQRAPAVPCPGPAAETLWVSVVSIDCAGILKLRNSDIELRKGETDIGRKNTRVRLVFRVHIPQPGGRVLSLQAASNPIECCEWPPTTLPGHLFFAVGRVAVTCIFPSRPYVSLAVMGRGRFLHQGSQAPRMWTVLLLWHRVCHSAWHLRGNENTWSHLT